MSYYRRIYFECLDNLTTAIKNRFDQPGYQIVCTLESIFLSRKEAEVKSCICKASKFFGNTSPEELYREIIYLWANSLEFSSFLDVITFFRKLNPAEREMYPKCLDILTLIILSPSSNAESERSFSTLKRIKFWLWASMRHKRLNHCMVMNIHSDKVDCLDIEKLVNYFITAVPQRSNIFKYVQ